MNINDDLGFNSSIRLARYCRFRYWRDAEAAAGGCASIARPLPRARTMDDVFASIAGTAIVIALMLSGSMHEALSLGHTLDFWLSAVLPV